MCAQIWYKVRGQIRCFQVFAAELEKIGLQTISIHQITPRTKLIFIQSPIQNLILMLSKVAPPITPVASLQNKKKFPIMQQTRFAQQQPLALLPAPRGFHPNIGVYEACFKGGSGVSDFCRKR